MCNVAVVQSLSCVPHFVTPEMGVTSLLRLTPHWLWCWPGHMQGPLYVMYISVHYVYRIVHRIRSTYLSCNWKFVLFDYFHPIPHFPPPASDNHNLISLIFCF